MVLAVAMDAPDALLYFIAQQFHRPKLSGKDHYFLIGGNKLILAEVNAEALSFTGKAYAS